ncbi:Uma2 family endonuclease [Algoriphagus aquaeductus]|uniref:Uma2 family endonuclease n=1 Tax=Algoriphagus aquaeductus TaxID=475299 RepID=A0A326RQ95_9BACT|nr:Uma2 family endonuclease [Algoriphagus aquaeductus]PZV82226.1 Uma2 family endonuclease [Algoriphagus aquaeductus]
MKPYRIPEKENIDVSAFREPDATFSGYTYADYLNWDFEEIVELIKGKMFAKAAAPSRRHQAVSGNVFSLFHTFLKGHPCKVYSAPFDVRFSKDPDFKIIDSVVQPDISVICDQSKLDEKGCLGAPDLIVEILSPSNSQVELQNKYELYQEFGVKEYWIIHPVENTLQINILVNGVYQPSRLFTTGQKVTSTVLPGFELALEEVFEES